MATGRSGNDGTGFDDGSAAKLAELELENVEYRRQNEELKEKLAQREEHQAMLVDKLREAQRGGNGSLWPPKIYLVGLGLLIVVRLAVRVWGQLYGFLGLASEVLFVGFAFVLLGKWLRAERGCNAAGVYIVKVLVLGVGLFVAALIATESTHITGSYGAAGSILGDVVDVRLDGGDAVAVLQMARRQHWGIRAASGGNQPQGIRT